MKRYGDSWCRTREESQFSLKVYLNTSFASIKGFFFLFRLFNSQITDARIETAEGYKVSAEARTHGRDHARWSQSFSTFVLSLVLVPFTEPSNPLLLPLLIWTDSLFCHSPRVIHHHLLSFLISAHLPSSRLPPHNFSSELSVSPLHLPSKAFFFPPTPSVSERWGGFFLCLCGDTQM